MTNSIAELENADVILVTGSNTTETHPVIATKIKKAVLFNGAKLIVADPRKIDLVKYTEKFGGVWLRQKNGTDVAWLNGMMNVILNEGLLDEEFVKTRTEDFEAFKKVIAQYPPEKVAKITGIPAESLITARPDLTARRKKRASFTPWELPSMSPGRTTLNRLPTSRC